MNAMRKAIRKRINEGERERERDRRPSLPSSKCQDVPSR